MTGSKKWIVTVGLIVIMATAFGLVVQAQEEEEAAPAQQQMTLIDVIKYGGVIEGVIILLSIAGLALIIEEAITMRRDTLIPPEILADIEVLFDEEQYEEALDLCESEDTFITKVLAAGLAKISVGYDAMIEGMEVAGEEETVRLNGKVSYLSLIGSTSPMLGLLGTVTGMIMAFNKIAAASGAANAADLASGISQALITTASGLIVAIPVMAAFFILKNKVMRISLEVSAVSSELVERFRPVAG